MSLLAAQARAPGTEPSGPPVALPSAGTNAAGLILLLPSPPPPRPPGRAMVRRPTPHYPPGCLNLKQWHSYDMSSR